MVIVSLVSGLGNQLFQYAMARQISLNLDTELKLDESFFSTQTLRALKLIHFNIEAGIATETEIHSITDVYTNRSYKNRIISKFDSIFRPVRFFVEKEWWTYQESANLARNVYVKGYWQHYKYYTHLDPVILKELTIKPELLKINWEIFDEVSNCQSVSVHIRRGDYISDPEASKLMGVLSLEYYYKAIEVIRGSMPNAVFYFFSDDIAWVKKEFSSIVKGKYVEGLQDYEDLALMSHCKHNIIANSSFSWWGAFLNKNSNKIVISPKRWVSDRTLNDRINIQMPEWLKL